MVFYSVTVENHKSILPDHPESQDEKEISCLLLDMSQRSLGEAKVGRPGEQQMTRIRFPQMKVTIAR